MADECKVFEQIGPRNPNAPIRVTPFLNYQVLSDDEVSTAFKGGTGMISVVSSVAGTLDFSTAAGVDPTGSVAPFPINANEVYDFDVKPGAKVRFDI